MLSCMEQCNCESYNIVLCEYTVNRNELCEGFIIIKIKEKKKEKIYIYLCLMHTTKCLPSNNKLFTYYGQSFSEKQARLLQLFLFVHFFPVFLQWQKHMTTIKNNERLSVVKCSGRDFLL